MVERKRRSTTRSYGSRMSKKRSKKSISSKLSSSNVYDEIPGLVQVRISPSLQSALSCRVGINITNSERWIYIYKQKLLDEINNKESRKEKAFQKIQAEIQSFPEDYILIGSYGGNDFFLCLSEYAKNVCENWMKEEKKQTLKKLFQFLYRDTNDWKTLGSDREIERIISYRDPFCTQLELHTHLNIKFDMRLVKDVKDGYAEFVNNRTTFNILFRRRVDQSSQVCGIKINNYTQTNAPAWNHRSVQYNFTYPEVKINKDFHLRLNKWFAENYNDISNHMVYNASINIYKNDYLELPNQKTRHSIGNPDLIMSFHDCVACHDKMINCIAWNAHMSGVVAAAYARVCPKFICKTPPIYQETHWKVTDTHLVLIWSVTQPVKPLLYLHAQREITAMNFCPFNRNILIGGCTDGQIIVWDLGGKLDATLAKSRLPATEADILIQEQMSWMKYPLDEQNVLPCIQSKFETCHKTHITGIKWLPSEYELTKMGEFVKCEENEGHMQFLTTAIGDSKMLVWDLQPKRIQNPLKRKGRKNRLTSRPKTLDEKKSPFAYLNVDFRPIFQLIFIDADSKKPIHVNDFSFKMGSFSYLALNPETLGNIKERTYFVRNNDMEHFTLEKKFLAATEFGQLYQCSWDAHEYNQGLPINQQNIQTFQCSSYHDGPIYHMQRHPFCPDLILTTGGRVFAIWSTIIDKIKKPILWRKAQMRYVMAVWSQQDTASIIASREDGKIELWDFDEDSKGPLRMTKLLGDQLLSVFVNNNFHHVLKKTCLTTEFTGILSIYTTPSELFVVNKKMNITENLQHILKRKNILNYWNDYTIRQRGQNDEEESESTTEEKAVIHCIASKEKICPTNTWQEKEYNRMYKILIERQRLNLVNIEKNKGALDEILESRSTRLRKIELYISKKEKIFQEEKSKLTEFDELPKKRRITTSFPKELTKMLKDQFYENYKSIEIEANEYIQSHRYRYFFDWQAMMLQAKQRVDEAVPKNRRHPHLSNMYSVLPPDVGRRSTKLLLTEIALVSSISGK